MELKSDCEMLAFSESGSCSSLPVNERRIILSSRGRRIRPGSKKVQLELKKQIEAVKFKVLSLAEEKGRAEGRLQRIKKEKLGVEDINKELQQRIENLNNERRRLQQFKLTLIEKRHRLSQLRSDVFLRKKQLISDLSLIYPLTLIDSVKRYSINGVQLPESDFQGYEAGGQASVALGYTAHLVSMVCFFLGIPLRYPIRHFGSRSRILDHITANIPEREREFPLYYKGKPDIFSIYGAYLLNKNIAQIRWYCGLVTQDLRDTLPNLASLIHNRLAIKGWDQNFDDDSLEMAQELTEETDRILFRSENSISLDQGLDDLRISEDRIQGNLSSSATNMDYDHAGNNSAAVGDVYRGRAQEKFLTGWRKVGQTQAEEVDPAWLVNSMDADSDCGRRLSTCVNRSVNSDLESSVVSNPEVDLGHSRRRKFGQVFLPEQYSEGSVASKKSNEVATDIITANTIESNHCVIPDDSLQARQLRLLDRKISMYFGDRSAINSSKRSSPVRRSRSVDRFPNVPASSDSDFSQLRKDGPQNDSREGSFPQPVADVNLVIGEPYFTCAGTSELSDAETENFEYHVNPPVEAPLPVDDKDGIENVAVIDTKQDRNESIDFPKENLPLPEKSESTSPEARCSSEDFASESKTTMEEDRNNTIPESSAMEDDCPIDKSFDDESLWNRTEALMSFNQSFNLIRKTTFDPK